MQNFALQQWPASHALGNTFAELHGWLGDAILWLAGLHATAAIYHHKILRDGVLASMLPLRAAARSIPRYRAGSVKPARASAARAAAP